MAERSSHRTWSERRDIVLTILGWMAIAFVALWVLGHIRRVVLLAVIAAMLSFALVPIVRFVERFLPRFLAILLVYLLAFGAIGTVMFALVSTAGRQLVSLAQLIRPLVTPTDDARASSLQHFLQRIGISQQQMADFGRQVTAHLEHFAGSAVPIATSILGTLLDVVVIVVLSIYFLIDGGRVSYLIRDNVPPSRREHAEFLLDTLRRVVGGYIRGQLLLATIISILVGVGMFSFHVPDAVLLGVLAFILAFIPILGTMISGATCVLLALTQGWLTALVVLAYFVAVHVLEGDILGPRITGRILGIHPALSLLAVVAGSELGGIVGALFAAPIAGLGQALLTAAWTEWKGSHVRLSAGMEQDMIGHN